jgi:rhodanese-related sulfurtransferase
VTVAAPRAGRKLSVGGVLAAVTVVLGVLAPLIGGRPWRRGPGVSELSRELATGRPLVDAITLAEWIRDRKPLAILDVRDSSAFVQFSVPTARNVPFEELRTQPIDSSRTLVLYDENGDAAVRGWLLLRRLGHPHVRILERGVLGWIDGVLQPVLPAGTPDERARYQRVAAVSRYFGGLPTIGPARPDSSTAAKQAVRLLSRRGCY